MRVCLFGSFIFSGQVSPYFKYLFQSLMDCFYYEIKISAGKGISIIPSRCVQWHRTNFICHMCQISFCIPYTVGNRLLCAPIKTLGLTFNPMDSKIMRDKKLNSTGSVPWDIRNTHRIVQGVSTDHWDMSGSYSLATLF